MLLDYRFRIKSYQQIQEEYFGEDVKNKEKNADKSKNKEIKSKSLTRLQGPSNNDNLDEFKPETVAHFFFADENGNLPSSLDLREVDLIYNDYIRVMTIMYEKCKNTYNTFVNRFLSEEQKQSNNI